MPKKQNPTAIGDRVSRKSSIGASMKFDSPIQTALQLPPIIAQHLRPGELLLIEAAAMTVVALIGGTTHG